MRNGFKREFVAAAAAFALLSHGCASWAQAVITPVARLLHVRATANGATNMPPDITRNPDVYGELSHQATITNGTVMARGSVTTDVQPASMSIRASGSATVNPPLSGSGDGSGQGVATVSLSTSTEFRVAFTSPDSGRFTVRDASGAIVHQHFFPQFIVYPLSLPGGVYGFEFTYQDGSNPGGSSGGSTGEVWLTVVPEPAAAALGLLVATACWLRPRRRRRH